MDPMYIGPFKIIARVDLPDELGQIHNTFYISQLHKCFVDDFVVVPLDDIHIDGCLNYIKRPIAVLNKKTKEVGLVKV